MLMNYLHTIFKALKNILWERPKLSTSKEPKERVGELRQ